MTWLGRFLPRAPRLPGPCQALSLARSWRGGTAPGGSGGDEGAGPLYLSGNLGAGIPFVQLLIKEPPTPSVSRGSGVRLGM